MWESDIFSMSFTAQHACAVTVLDYSTFDSPRLRASLHECACRRGRQLRCSRRAYRKRRSWLLMLMGRAVFARAHLMSLITLYPVFITTRTSTVGDLGFSRR
jgi:hypothetical protein